MNFNKFLTFSSLEDIQKFCKENSLKLNYNNDLYLIRYNRYNEKCNLDNSLNKLLRGTVFDRKTNKCVCYTFNMGVDYELFKKNNNIKDIRVEESIDGTMINVYFYKDKWYFSTKGMLDSNRCYWNSRKSFYQLFDDCTGNKTDKLLESLNKKYCYSFIITHPENRIVTRYETCGLYLCRVRDMSSETYKIVNEEINCKDVEILYPKTIEFKSYEELEKTVETLYYEKEGFMLYNKEMTERVKVKGLEYCNAQESKGNNKNPIYNLLERILTNTHTRYLKYYPDETWIVNDIIKKLNILTNDLFNLYMTVHVKKNKVEIPYKLKPLLYKLHGIFIENRKTNKLYKTTRRNILDYIYSLDVGKLYFVLFKPIPQHQQQQLPPQQPPQLPPQLSLEELETNTTTDAPNSPQ